MTALYFFILDRTSYLKTTQADNGLTRSFKVFDRLSGLNTQRIHSRSVHYRRWREKIWYRRL